MKKMEYSGVTPMGMKHTDKIKYKIIFQECDPNPCNTLSKEISREHFEALYKLHLQLCQKYIGERK